MISSSRTPWSGSVPPSHSRDPATARRIAASSAASAVVAFSPAKRRLSQRLTEGRLRTGYTANHACDILNWGRGKAGRFEANQWKRPEMSDIRDLIRIYGIEGREKEENEPENA